MSKVFQSFAIILAPLYVLRTYIVVPTTFLEITIFLAFASTAIDFLKFGKSFKIFRNDFNLLIFLFLIAVLIEVFVSPNIFGGLGIYRAYFVEPILFFYCLLFTVSRGGYRYIINSLLISGCWLSVLAIIQKTTGHYSLAPYEMAQGRIPALYNSANALALYLGPITVIAFGLFCRELSKKRFLYLFLFLLFSIVIIWTKSRGGEISMLISLLFFGIITLFIYSRWLFKLKNFFIAGFFIACIVASVLFYVNTNFFPAEKGRSYTRVDTLQIRYFIWAGTVDLLKDHPFFGAGLDGFKTVYSSHYRLPEYQEEVQYPHNIFLTFWAETGILGLASFLLIYVSALSKLFRGLLKNKELFLGIGFIGALCYIMIHGLVDVPYFKNDLSLEFWVLIALVVGWAKKENLDSKSYS